jgi:hypothetical protein
VLPGITAPRLDPCHLIEVRLLIHGGSASSEVAPPRHSARSLHRVTPPTDTAKWGAGQRAPSTACDHSPLGGSVPSHRRTLINSGRIGIQPSHSAKSLRQLTPPTDTAKRGAGQRAPSAAWDHSPPVESVSSHLSVLINPGWINIRPSHSARSLRQVAPPSRSAKPVRQLTPPNGVPVRERQALPAITAPSADPCHLIEVRLSIRGGLASSQVTSPDHTARSHRQITPPDHTAKSLRQGTPPSQSAN